MDRIYDKFVIVCAGNDKNILGANIMSSYAVSTGAVPLHLEWKASSAAIAYNSGIDSTEQPYLVFAHQDVYLPREWFTWLEGAILDIEERDPTWALIGCWGIAKDFRHHGFVWSSGVKGLLGRPVINPIEVQSIDELLIVMRRSAGLRFDSRMPFWHLYGTDIVQTAIANGRSAWVANLPVVHNDSFKGNLDQNFALAYAGVRNKWRGSLPIRTPVVMIDRCGFGLARYKLNAKRSFRKRAAQCYDPTLDPRHYAIKCGWSV